MAAYVFGIRNQLSDEASFNRYVEAATPTLEGTGVRNLALYGRFRVLEGGAAEGAFVLEFLTYEAAEAWFDSSDYQEAMTIRRGAADYRIVLVEGCS